MSPGKFTFSSEQLNRQFPFHILVNADFTINSTGKSLAKITGNYKANLFTTHFVVKGSEEEDVNFNFLKTKVQKLVLLEIKNENRNLLRGSFEFLEVTSQLLFTGSLWLNSLQELDSSPLANNDFAHHDAVIDLLHLLQIRELINEDLKELFNKVNQQKKALNIAALQNQNLLAHSKKAISGLIMFRELRLMPFGIGTLKTVQSTGVKDLLNCLDTKVKP